MLKSGMASRSPIGIDKLLAREFVPTRINLEIDLTQQDQKKVIICDKIEVKVTSNYLET